MQGTSWVWWLPYSSFPVRRGWAPGWPVLCSKKENLHQSNVSLFYWNTHIRDNSLEKFSKDWSSNKLDTKSSQCWTLWKQNFILTSPVTFCLLHFPPLPSSQPPIYICINLIFKQSKRSQKLNYCLLSKRTCVQIVDIHHLPLICQKLLSPTPAVSRA